MTPTTPSFTRDRMSEQTAKARIKLECTALLSLSISLSTKARSSAQPCLACFRVRSGSRAANRVESNSCYSTPAVASASLPPTPARSSFLSYLAITNTSIPYTMTTDPVITSPGGSARTSNATGPGTMPMAIRRAGPGDHVERSTLSQTPGGMNFYGSTPGG